MPVNREFRVRFGYTNADRLRKYYKGKDIVDINWNKIEQYNSRIKDIFQKLNTVVHESIRYDDITDFNHKIDGAYQILKDNDIIPRLNNNGRPPEDVYYNWMRGYAVCEFFSKALSIVFNISRDKIKIVGNDKLSCIDTFSKSPTADLEIELDNKIIRLEVQSGFTGANDIKHHKVNEAERVFSSANIYSYVVHFDLFNGKVAIIDISSISDENINWVHRQEFENQIVFSIPSESFKWAITAMPTNYKNIIC